LREGCIIPNLGGGLCQISNALYDAALQANLEIVERHRHTQIVTGSLAEHGRDATVFWNYVDLRFRSSKPIRIEARLDSENLIVEFRGEKVTEKTLHQISSRNAKAAEIGSCATCEVGDCHRVVKPASERNFGRSAWLVDEFMPEFDEYLQRERSNADLLCVPIDGKRFRRSNYAWDTRGFKQVQQSFFVTAIRSYRSRKLAAQGAARQRNLLDMYEALAESYAKRLSYDCLHVTVQQNLLPYLWLRGHLGGRTFDVLMTALPMTQIQSKLDRAAALHPDSTTLGDFRADPSLVTAETEALKNARHIVTPHSGIASLFGERSVLLDWKMPEAKAAVRPEKTEPTIVFPASTVGRKGCYELREALRGLDVKLITLGPFIESANFWDGFDVERGATDWLERADLVVLPAFVEHKPRRLIAAVAAGIPVIASDDCGVSRVAGVTVVDAGDSSSLAGHVRALLAGKLRK
ncbi:MAG: VanW family protein, partial [Pyrinomonadaceae bacterium]